MNKYKHNYLDPWYQSLLSLLVSEDQSFSKSDRTGTGTKSLFGVQFRHDMSDGFPLLTTKKMAWKTMVTELLWFLRGSTDIRFLWQNNCSIWDGDWLKHYETTCSSPYSLEEMKKFALAGDKSFDDSVWDLGPIYGKQWRKWQTSEGYNSDAKWMDMVEVDQIANLINELKTNPDSRRLMVSAWNVGELNQMILPPCHYGFQMYTRELNLEERRKLVTAEMHAEIYTGGDPSTLSHSEIDQWSVPKRAISLMWNQRSVDTFLGLPFNIASYGLLLEIIAKTVNMVPDQLIGNLGDVHLYNNHLEQAKEQISRSAFELPTLKMNPIFLANLEHKGLDEAINDHVNFELENYQSHPSIKAPLSN